MFCKNCGNQIDQGSQFCKNCGTCVSDEVKVAAKDENKKSACLPAFILGLIGSIFGIFGGICMTMCDIIGGGFAPFILIFCGSIIGLIGACLCLSKCKIGSVLQIVAAFMIIMRAYSVYGADLMTVVALLMFLFGGLIGAVYGFIINKK